MESIIHFVVNFADQYPAVASILFIIGSLRVFLKPVFSLLHAYVDFTSSSKDNEILDKVEASPISKAIFYALDYIASVKVKK